MVGKRQFQTKFTETSVSLDKFFGLHIHLQSVGDGAWRPGQNPRAEEEKSPSALAVLGSSVIKNTLGALKEGEPNKSCPPPHAKVVYSVLCYDEDEVKAVRKHGWRGAGQGIGSTQESLVHRCNVQLATEGHCIVPRRRVSKVVNQGLH